MYVFVFAPGTTLTASMFFLRTTGPRGVREPDAVPSSGGSGAPRSGAEVSLGRRRYHQDQSTGAPLGCVFLVVHLLVYLFICLFICLFVCSLSLFCMFVCFSVDFSFKYLFMCLFYYILFLNIYERTELL